MAYLLTGTENNHIKIKARTVEFMKIHRKKYYELMIGKKKTFDKHIENVMEGKSKAPCYEVNAMAHLYGRNIEVYYLINGYEPGYI